MPPKRKHKDDDEDWVPSDNQSTVNYRKLVNKSAHSKEIKDQARVSRFRPEYSASQDHREKIPL
jgi:hypothetical protein